MILPTKEDKEQKMKNKDELMSSFKWCIDNDRMPKIDAPFDISFKEYCSTIKFFAHDPKFFVEKIKMIFDKVKKAFHIDTKEKSLKEILFGKNNDR